MVRCKICGKELASEAGLRQHHNDKHLNEPFPPMSKTAGAGPEPRPKSGGIRQGLQSKRRKRRVTILGIALVVIIGTGAGGYALYNSIEHPSASFGAFPFPCSSSTAMHIHPYLRIVIEGANITIPADVGMTGSCLEPMHTHDASGVIHLEAPDTSTNYTLGQFFDIWEATYGTVSINGTNHPVIFNSTDILGYRADATHQVVLLVDGKGSIQYGSLVLNTLDYCSAATTGAPCSPTAVGDPAYGTQTYPYGTGQTIVIEYTTISG